MPAGLVRTSYASRTAPELGPPMSDGILTSVRRKHGRARATGLLTFRSDGLLQRAEGRTGRRPRALPPDLPGRAPCPSGVPALRGVRREAVREVVHGLRRRPLTTETIRRFIGSRRFEPTALRARGPSRCRPPPPAR